MNPSSKSNPPKDPELNKQFWDDRWKTKDTGWDLHSISPPLKEYIDTLVNKDLAILIPGCGNAYEAEYLLNSGFTNVTLIDISPTLVGSLLERFQLYAGRELTLICGDFFRHTGQYDLVLEQTFFCALSPDLRKDYAEKMQSLLAKDRKLVGVLFDKTFESSPPFGGSKKEYEKLFKDYFEIETMEACTNSVQPRAGFELFIEFRKKASEDQA